jgi:hypothetical protein
VSLHHPNEIALFELILTSPECVELEVQVTIGLHAGLILLLRHKPVGYWLASGKQLVFQRLRCDGTRLLAETPCDALAITISTLQADRQKLRLSTAA